MIRAEMIPDEVVEAAARADYEMIRGEAVADHGIVAERWYCPWKEASDDAKAYHMDHARAAIAAALSAWPGAFPWTFNGPLPGTGFVLPMPQEPRDE